MNLCWFIPQDTGGGVASVALSCCRQAAAAGHDVTLLLMAESSGMADEYMTFSVDELGLCTSSDRRRAPQALVEWLQDHPQDVLFFNRCLASEPALPYIPLSTHTCFVVHDTAPMFWEGAIEHESVLDAVIAVSKTVASRFSHRLADSSKLSVLHNGTLLPERPDPSTDRTDDLLFLGGDKPKKGAHDLLDLWPRLVERGFDGHLHWFGSLDTSFEQRVTHLPACDSITTYGHAPRSTIFDQASRAKVLLMLSRVEPFGMATIEGMGMGCLPVAWDIETGTSEIVEPGRTGFVAPLGNHAALAETVIEACDRHSSFADEAMTVARTQFSEEAMWDRYAELIDNLKDRPVIHRPRAGDSPPAYEPPTRYFQLLPDGLRAWIRDFIGRSPRLGYWLRDLRGR
jgi:glycosyltransferase involved in cell wall biosynthesis